MTGSTLYEAVEQQALWNRLLVAVMSDLNTNQGFSQVRSYAFGSLRRL